MSTPKTKFFTYPAPGTPDFYRQMDEGMRRAPIERAKAVREFWNWIRSAI